MIEFVGRAEMVVSGAVELGGRDAGLEEIPPGYACPVGVAGGDVHGEWNAFAPEEGIGVFVNVAVAVVEGDDDAFGLGLTAFEAFAEFADGDENIALGAGQFDEGAEGVRCVFDVLAPADAPVGRGVGDAVEHPDGAAAGEDGFGEAKELLEGAVEGVGEFEMLEH